MIAILMIILILAGLGCLILLGIHSDDENGEFIDRNLTFRLKTNHISRTLTAKI